MGLRYMPVRETVAIIYLSPFLVMLAAIPLLKERATVVGWIGAGLGFLGVLLIIRRGAEWLWRGIVADQRLLRGQLSCSIACFGENRNHGRDVVSHCLGRVGCVFIDDCGDGGGANSARLGLGVATDLGSFGDRGPFFVHLRLPLGPRIRSCADQLYAFGVGRDLGLDRF